MFSEASITFTIHWQIILLTPSIVNFCISNHLCCSAEVWGCYWLIRLMEGTRAIFRGQKIIEIWSTFRLGVCKHHSAYNYVKLTPIILYISQHWNVRSLCSCSCFQVLSSFAILLRTSEEDKSKILLTLTSTRTLLNTHILVNKNHTWVGCRCSSLLQGKWQDPHSQKSHSVPETTTQLKHKSHKIWTRFKNLCRTFECRLFCHVIILTHFTCKDVSQS